MYVFPWEFHGSLSNNLIGQLLLFEEWFHFPHDASNKLGNVTFYFYIVFLCWSFVEMYFLLLFLISICILSLNIFLLQIISPTIFHYLNFISFNLFLRIRVYAVYYISFASATIIYFILLFFRTAIAETIYCDTATF